MKKDHTLRLFQPGDENQTSRIYNFYYGKYNGFSRKDACQWKQAFVNHPQIGERRILVWDSGELSGYAAYGKDGIIYDICVMVPYDPEAVYRALLAGVIRTAYREGVKDLVTNIPGDNVVLKRILRQLGLVEMKKDSLAMIKVVHMKKMVMDLLKTNEIYRKFPFEIVFNVKMDFEPLSLNLFRGYNIQFTSIPDTANACQGKISLECGWRSMEELIFSRKSFWFLLLRRKILVRPLSSVMTIGRLLSEISLETDWFIPMVDWR